MIIRTADQYPRLLHADFLHQPEIILAGPDPAGDLRKLISSLHTFIDGIPVFPAVQEKFAGPDHPSGASQLVQIIVDRHDLFRGIGRP